MAKRIQRSSSRPTQAAPASGGAAPAPAKKLRGRVPRQLITDFTVQLGTLSEAGIPVVKALTILEGQAKAGPFKGVIGELNEDVAGGMPLSEALAKHTKAFNTLYCSMVRAGEVGGVLDEILVRIAAFREKAEEIRAKIQSATIYPVIVGVVAFGVVAAVVTFVIPRFEEIFQSFNVKLPGITVALLGLSTFVQQYWYLVFGAPIVLGFLHLFVMRRRRGYRRAIHAVMLKLPIMGGVINKQMTTEFSRTFGTLIQAGVPHLDALTIVRDATTNEVLVDAVEDIRRTVREGEGIARPMGETGLFDDIVTNMVDVGEETGELDGMLLKVANAYEKQLDRQIDSFFRILEPAMLVIMAAVVGTIVVALFLPLLEIMNSISSAS
ncbi:MAG: type IV pilus assembly protein PilC [Planctomycetota bacterium]|jgi:type IV pilus assembly protein PilC